MRNRKGGYVLEENKKDKKIKFEEEEGGSLYCRLATDPFEDIHHICTFQEQSFYAQNCASRSKGENGSTLRQTCDWGNMTHLQPTKHDAQPPPCNRRTPTSWLFCVSIPYT
jgi:hypothetical protein